MAEIIKTWPANVSPRTVARIFSEDEPPFCRFYFALGRGKPKLAIERLWFTYRGRILGSFEVAVLAINDGSLPRLRSLSGETSEWQIAPDRWVAICDPPCRRIRQRVFMSGFRGWHYFNFEEYRQTAEARMRL